MGEAGMGRLKTSYRQTAVTIAILYVPLLLGVAMMASMALIWGSEIPREHGWHAFLHVALTTAAVLAGFALARLIPRYWPHRIDLHEHGVVWRRGARSLEFRFADIDAVYLRRRRFVSTFGRGGAETVDLRVVRRDGASFRILPTIAQVETLVAAVEDAVYCSRFPDVAAALNQGATVEFGPLRLSQEGLSTKRKPLLPWNRLSIEVVNGVIVIREQGRFFSWKSFWYSQVPNPRLFLDVSSQLWQPRPTASRELGLPVKIALFAGPAALILVAVLLVPGWWAEHKRAKSPCSHLLTPDELAPLVGRPQVTPFFHGTDQSCELSWQVASLRMEKSVGTFDEFANRRDRYLGDTELVDKPEPVPELGGRALLFQFRGNRYGTMRVQQRLLIGRPNGGAVDLRLEWRNTTELRPLEATRRVLVPLLRERLPDTDAYFAL